MDYSAFKASKGFEMKRLPSGTFNVSYAQELKIFRSLSGGIWLLLLLLLLLLIPHFVRQYWLDILSTTAITIIALQGLNILSGYCGQISIGHTAFMAIGAYASALLSGRLGLPFYLCVPCAGLGAGLIGVFFGLSSLKVKGFYLALTTIAAQFIIIYIIRTPFPDVTGGAIALQVPEFSLGGIVFNTEMRLYYLVLVFTILMTFFSTNLMRSHIGRAFIAIRDNEISAEAMGINLYRYKLLAFFIGCFYAGIAGCIWSVYVKVISPDDFTLMGSVWQVGMLIIGGMGHMLGPFIGAILIKALNEIVMLSGPMITSVVPHMKAQVSAAMIEMIFGLALVLFLVFMPRGIAHRLEILRESIRLWPFSY